MKTCSVDDLTFMFDGDTIHICRKVAAEDFFPQKIISIPLRAILAMVRNFNFK